MLWGGIPVRTLPKRAYCTVQYLSVAYLKRWLIKETSNFGIFKSKLTRVKDREESQSESPRWDCEQVYLKTCASNDSGAVSSSYLNLFESNELWQECLFQPCNENHCFAAAAFTAISLAQYFTNSPRTFKAVDLQNFSLNFVLNQIFKSHFFPSVPSPWSRECRGKLRPRVTKS